MGIQEAEQNVKIKNRLQYLDVLKCFAIFLVLWGHSIMHLNDQDRYANPVFVFITSFHMPLFMVMVGYFSYSSLKRTFSSFLKHKFIQLLLPTITWGILFVLIYSCISGDFGMGGGKIIDFIHSFWFLKSAFFCYLIFYIFFRNIKEQWLAIIFSILLSQVIPIYKVSFMYPCFVCGYLIHKNWEFIDKNKTVLLVLSVLLFFSCFALFPEEWYYQTQTLKQGIIEGNSNSLVNFALMQFSRIIMGVAAALALIIIFYIAEKAIIWSKLFHFSSVWGQYTMIVYILQSFLLETLLARYLKFNGIGLLFFSLIIAPLISIMILWLCIIIGKTIERIPQLTLFFLGKPYKNK